jgi:hypothetical protein
VGQDLFLGRLGAGALDFAAHFVSVFMVGLDAAATVATAWREQQQKGLDPRKQHLLVKEHGVASIVAPCAEPKLLEMLILKLSWFHLCTRLNFLQTFARKTTNDSNIGGNSCMQKSCVHQVMFFLKC